jgi:hypothetical protein
MAERITEGRAREGPAFLPPRDYTRALYQPMMPT